MDCGHSAMAKTHRAFGRMSFRPDELKIKIFKNLASTDTYEMFHRKVWDEKDACKIERQKETRKPEILSRPLIIRQVSKLPAHTVIQNCTMNN